MTRPRLGPFKLGAVLGHGGNATVWHAVHTTATAAATGAGPGREVAVKVLEVRESLEARAAELFRREVQGIAALHHPRIVTIYDHGTVDADAAKASGGRLREGSPWLAMELVPGGNLFPRCGRLPWTRVQQMLLALLDALAHAHARGIVHRDIKPANVLLGPRGVKLTDFGLAHAFAADGADADGNRIVGTPAYMAPEQFEARWRDYGPWTDLYAVGCLAWAMTTGKPPFGIRRPVAESMVAHLEQDPPPLDARMPVPEGFEPWCRTLLAKRIDRRFVRAADAAAALARLHVDDDDVTLPPPGGDTSIDFSDEDVSLTTLVLPDGLAGEVLRRYADGGSIADDTVAPDRPPVPPLPAAWRTPAVEPARRWMRGVGLGLFGVRDIPLVDRDAERDRVWRALRTVHRTGRTQVVVLRGAAGTGKSRLARWVSERAHEVGGAVVLRASHSPVHGPRDGLGAMVGRHLRCGGLDHAATRSRLRLALHGLRPPDGELDALAQLVTPAHGDDRAVEVARPEEWYATLHRLLLRFCRERPVLLWLDDVQWGLDALGFVLHLLERDTVTPAPILVVLTVREEALRGGDPEAEWLEQIAGDGRTDVVAVDPLLPRDRPTLVRQLLGLEGPVAAQVEERTAGNPLFAVQLVGDWVRRGMLVAGDRGFRLRDGAAVELPDDLHGAWIGILGRFVADRPRDDALALEIAATLGQDPVAAELAEACRIASVTPSADLAGALVDARLARWEGRGGDWSFANGMLRESLERGAREAGRGAAHNRACAAMLADVEGAGERRGLHLLRAGEHEAALDPLLAAAKARSAAGESISAGRLLKAFDKSAALGGLPPEDERWGRGWLLGGTLARSRGDVERATELNHRAEAAARRHGWDGLLPAILLERGNQLMDRFETAAALAQYREAGRLFGAAKDRKGQAECWMLTGFSHAYAGRLEDATTCFGESLAAFQEVGDVRGEGFSREGLSSVAATSGDAAASREHARAGLAIARRDGLRALEGRCLILLGDAARLDEEFDLAERHYRDALALFEAIGSGLAGITEAHVGWVLVERGILVQARRVLEPCLARMEEEGRRHFVATCELGLLTCEAADGRWGVWDRRIRRAEEVLGEIDFVDVTCPRLARCAARRAADAGREDEARAAWALALAGWQRLGWAAEIAEAEEALARS